MEYKQAEQKLEQKLEENSLRTRWKLRNQEAESTEELQKNSIGDMVRKKVLKRVLKVILINIRRMQPRVVCWCNNCMNNKVSKKQINSRKYVYLIK